MYDCGPETETTSRFSSFFFLRCQLIVNERQKMPQLIFLSIMNQIFFE